jgi:hypothetical protein
MRKSISTILAASGAIALAVSLSATSAGAATATTWTVTPGGSLSGKSGTTTLTDTKTGAVLTCTSSTATGTAKSGSGLTNPLANLSNVTFSTCTGPAGLTFDVTTSAFPWHLNGTSYTSPTAKGTITHIHAVLKGTNSSCTATVDGTSATADNGTVHVSHSNAAATKLNVLKAGDNLHAYNVSGCLGALNSGDPATFVATYTLSKAQTITSP